MSMKNIIQAIKKNKRFLISTHVNPDPDALCSELALAMYLRSLGKKVTIVNNESVGRRFWFIPGIHHIKHYWEKREMVYDVAIILDCGELSRVGKVQDMIQKAKPLVNIDHHITNDQFGSLNLVRPKSSSTAEVLYDLLKQGGCVFTRTLAMHLYVGIMTDTGSFRYENTTARTHAIVAELMKFKFSAPSLYQKLYETILFRDLKEFTKVIGRLRMTCGGRVACITLGKRILRKFSGEFDLRDTIFKFLRSIKNVEVVVILTEIGRNKTRINLRSSNAFDVAKLANHFRGGGHRRASGCTVDKSIPRARKEILERIRRML
jgi:bifunctional oligoribonuclease and PAP phosphatase NrnA